MGEALVYGLPHLSQAAGAARIVDLAAAPAGADMGRDRLNGGGGAGLADLLPNAFAGVAEAVAPRTRCGENLYTDRDLEVLRDIPAVRLRDVVNDAAPAGRADPYYTNLQLYSRSPEGKCAARPIACPQLRPVRQRVVAPSAPA
jgi:hypothetical protein